MVYTIILKDVKGVITNVISFDTITDFSTSLSATVVKTPVENGFPITDHISNENEKFDITGIVTNFSIFDEGLELRWDGTKFVSQSPINYENRHLEIEREIKDLIRKRRVFTLLRSESNSHLSSPSEKYKQLLNTRVEEFQTCVCSNLQISENTGNDQAVYVKMQVEQIRVANILTRELTDQERQPSLVAKKAQVKSNVASNQSTAKAADKEGAKSGTVAEKANDDSKLTAGLEKTAADFEKESQQKAIKDRIGGGYDKVEKAELEIRAVEAQLSKSQSYRAD